MTAFLARLYERAQHAETRSEARALIQLADTMRRHEQEQGRSPSHG